MSRLIIRIPQPCHEQWEEMQPADRGRFCARCQKTVVDYTNYSDQELVKLLSQPLPTTCGRFRDEQLNRSLKPLNPSTSAWRHWVSLLTMGLFSWQTAKAQLNQDSHSKQSISPRPAISVSAIPIRNQADRNTNLSIKGRVMLLDSTHRLSPASGIEVRVYQAGQTWQTETDSSGIFSLTVRVRASDGPVQAESTKFVINASAPDTYRMPASLTIEVNSSETSVTVNDIILYGTMRRREITGGGICLIKAPSRWQRVKQKLFH